MKVLLLWSNKVVNWNRLSFNIKWTNISHHIMATVLTEFGFWRIIENNT